MPEVMESKGRCVQDGFQIDFIDQVVGFLKLAVGVEILFKKAGTSRDSSVGEGVVDAAVLLLGKIKEGAEIIPGSDIGFDEGVVVVLDRRRIEIARHHQSTDMQK